MQPVLPKSPSGSEEVLQCFRRLMWRVRLEAEIQNSRYASFLSLTFEEYPSGERAIPSKVWQRYMYRLRRRLEYRKKRRAIRYFCCQELGSENGRPHFHALITCSEHVTRSDLIRPWHEYSARVDVAGWKNGEVADLCVIASPDKRVGSHWAQERSRRATDKRKHYRQFPRTAVGTARYLAKYLYKDVNGAVPSRPLHSQNPSIGCQNLWTLNSLVAERVLDLCVDEAKRLNHGVPKGDRWYLDAVKARHYMREQITRLYEKGGEVHV